MVNNTLSTYKGLALTILAAIFMPSCRTTKNISTAKVNTDSVVTHVKDSMKQVHSKEITDLNRMIEEMTSSGVTFVVDSCPERDAVLALLDSTGRANYEKIMLERRVKDLSNKVTISEKGVITAEGNIKAAYFTASKMEQEVKRVERTNDSLVRVIESDSIRFTQSIQTKDKDVKRSSPIPWILFILACIASSFVGWWVRGKISVKRLVT